jgi:ribose/xylose/arabinose/galactoside ABC-type transport system permease subunit
MRLLTRIGIVLSCTLLSAIAPVRLLIWLDNHSKLDVFMVNSVNRGDFEPIQIALVLLLAAICGGALGLFLGLRWTRPEANPQQ